MLYSLKVTVNTLECSSINTGGAFLGKPPKVVGPEKPFVKL